jgi:23S rRNA (guanosine2251-2'-O)-methyltransferase
MTKHRQPPYYLYGFHTISTILAYHPERIKKLILSQQRTDQRLDALISEAEALGIAVQWQSAHSMSQQLGGQTHQGVAALCQPKAVWQEKQLPELLEQIQSTPFLLILDGIQDPHNLGACFRSADAAGVDAIILPKDKTVGLTPTVERVACGAVETVPLLQATNLVRLLKQLKEAGIWVFGLDSEAQGMIYQADLTAPTALVLGAEGGGLRALTKQHCDALYALPMAGTIASLNVSVAAGISLFEVSRQRLNT